MCRAKASSVFRFVLLYRRCARDDRNRRGVLYVQTYGQVNDHRISPGSLPFVLTKNNISPTWFLGVGIVNLFPLNSIDSMP
jgi:hypothetical protein